ncbi:chemotaxis protein CheD [Propionivibrio soli]|uniref:chemotaxis protein CheD n=1 Tax=Propionivibrio soli TaxID=2976531 RepID=UPI0021E993D5|nr:chemotaxis protein CheD [Propionivibrio soli]
MTGRTANTDDIIQVVLKPGDFHFGGGRTRISTLLGSCVSVTLWHPKKHIGGMCHYMLTERDRPSGVPLDGRYAAEAFALFLQNVAAASTRPCEYQAKLFGGANMFNWNQGDGSDIGARNIEYAHRMLAANHITLMAEHVAGSGRRKLHFDVWSGEVWLAFPDGENARIRNPNG